MATAIVDGHYLLHRTMRVPHLRMLSTKAGKPTGAVFGYLKSLRSTINTLKEIKKLIVVFDGGHSKRRKEVYEGYKDRKREDEMDPDGLTFSQKFGMQLKYLKFILPRLGINTVHLPGREGDDLVAVLSKNLEDSLKIVVSDDRDMYQLVDDSTHVWRPLAEERVCLMNFDDLAGCTPENFLLRKACLGDSSDTIPGIKGVGPKTVDSVFAECDDIGEYPYENFFETALMMKGKKVQSIAENLDIILRNYELVDMSREEFTKDEIESVLNTANAKSSFDVMAVKRIFTGFEFFSLVEDFNQWVVPFQMLR